VWAVMLKMTTGAWRKVALIAVPVIVIWWMWSDRNTLYAKVAELESRLKFTANNADSLATQLRVINSHKEKIEKMLGDERESRLNSARDLESQLTSVREQYELIKVSESLVDSTITQSG